MYTNLHRFAHCFAALGFMGAIFAGAAYADVSPGDKITGANKDQIKGLIPDELFPFVAESFAAPRCSL